MPEQKWTQTDWNACLKDSVGRALVAVGLHLEGAAKAEVPVDTGRLGGSITWAVHNKGSMAGPPPRPPKRQGPPATQADIVDRPTDEWTLHVGTAVEYAPYMEYGTRYTKAQSFLRVPLDRNKKEVQEIFAEALRGGIRRHGK